MESSDPKFLLYFQEFSNKFMIDKNDIYCATITIWKNEKESTMVVPILKIHILAI